jgi:hypothetical protein
MHRAIPFFFALLICQSFTHAATHYVSPQGDDSAVGTSIDHAWKTCAKVNDTKLIAGDAILFQRSGQWHESLRASSDGEPGKCITYDAYGNGAKPVFIGSDLLDNQKFTPAGQGKYAYPTARADSALCNHLFIPCTWDDGTLTITSGTDPRRGLCRSKAIGFGTINRSVRGISIAPRQRSRRDAEDPILV